MRYLPLLWAGLFRRKARTILTILSVVISFLLLGLLDAVTVAFESGADSADAKRLLTTARYSIIEPLPLSYLRRIEQVPGAAPAGAAGVLVPAAAVRVEGKAGIVFVFADDKVQRRSVTLGRSVGPDRQVLSGLSAGERVVLSPPASLGDGTAVKLAPGS